MAAACAPHIRLLSADDLDGAFSLSSTAGWNQRRADWSMLLQIAPAGSFCAIAEGRILGTAIGIDYGTFGWIAMMLVDPAYRGQGLGARLLEAAMGAIPPNQPIRLDATPLGRPLYQRYGFEEETILSRRVREAPGHEPGEDMSSDVRPLVSDDLSAVTQHDRQVFGGNRHAVLQWSFDHAPQYAHIIKAGSGLPQYCFGRTGRLFDQIGPVIAGNDDMARALVSRAMRAAEGRPVVIDSFDARRGFSAWLEDVGFQVQRPLYRMCRPGGAWPPQSDTVIRGSRFEFGILGPEFG